MNMWDGWPATRVIILFTGLAFLMISLQVYLFHSRQNFRHWAMYGPVLAGPALGILSLVLVYYTAPVFSTTMAFLYWVGIASGLYGTVLHVNGIGQRVGGFQESQNYLTGPPPVLPAMFAAISALGLIGLYWR